VQPEQLGPLARLVVPLDHRLVSRVRLEGKLGTVVDSSRRSYSSRSAIKRILGTVSVEFEAGR
jgi:hypothetical protein